MTADIQISESEIGPEDEIELFERAIKGAKASSIAFLGDIEAGLFAESDKLPEEDRRGRALSWYRSNGFVFTDAFELTPFGKRFIDWYRGRIGGSNAEQEEASGQP